MEVKKSSVPSNLKGLEFNYEVMEEELTCAVCLELYADPLMLPCSHSVCKKCLQDIFDSRTKGNKDSADFDLECPSCRKEVKLTRDKIHDLPKNLALENVVIRYSEERSKSIRQSLSLESPIADLVFSPISDGTDLPEFPSDSKTNCELCETQKPDRAVWYCSQCEVAYCHACFAKFHPRRGPLARHKVRPPQGNEDRHRAVYCNSHETEVVTIFCDTCKVLICHMCVCDGEGSHGGHHILSPEGAHKIMKDSAKGTAEECRSLLDMLAAQKDKMHSYINDIKELQQLSLQQVEQQCNRLVADLTSALTLERDKVVQYLQQVHTAATDKAESSLAENEKNSALCSQLLEQCQSVAEGTSAREILVKATKVQPLVAELHERRQVLENQNSQCEGLLKDKTCRIQLQSSTEQFKKDACSILSLFQDNGVSQYESIVPFIKTPASPGRPDLASPNGSRSHAQNKYLITWGFTSTSFTGDCIEQNSSWTVTIERNTGQWGSLNTGYLFGVGISAKPLNVRDQVGSAEDSCGITCCEGAIHFTHNSKQEHVTDIRMLPLSICISVNIQHPLYTVVTYKLVSSSDGQGLSLQGRRVISDENLKGTVYPVFTVSQRVKLLFPTYV